jgi:GTP-binding protein
LLLHLIDVAPPDPDVDPLDAIDTVVAELEQYSAELAALPRWLVLNKVDLLDAAALADLRERAAAKLEPGQPIFAISAATGEGVEALAQAVMRDMEFRAELDAAGSGDDGHVA